MVVGERSIVLRVRLEGASAAAVAEQAERLRERLEGQLPRLFAGLTVLHSTVEESRKP